MKTYGIRKHIALILAIFTAVFFLAGCSSTPGPTETADTFLKALKEQDGEKLAEVFVGGDLDLLKAVADTEDDTETADTGLTKVYEEQMLPKMLDFDYELSNEQIDGDKATVDVKITNYRIGDAFTAFFSEYISQAFIMAFSDASEEDMDMLATTILSGKLADLAEKSYEKTATINLINKDGKWVVDLFDTNSDFLDGVTGGLLTSFGNMEDMFSGWGEEE